MGSDVAAKAADSCFQKFRMVEGPRVEGAFRVWGLGTKGL